MKDANEKIVTGIYNLEGSFTSVFDDPWGTPPKILKDNKGNQITLERYKELYCECDCRDFTVVRVLHIDHNICKGCKKEKK